jgi:hypothetical protein
MDTAEYDQQETAAAKAREKLTNLRAVFRTAGYTRDRKRASLELQTRLFNDSQDALAAITTADNALAALEERHLERLNARPDAEENREGQFTRVSVPGPYVKTIVHALVDSAQQAFDREAEKLARVQDELRKAEAAVADLGAQIDAMRDALPSAS